MSLSQFLNNYDRFSAGEKACVLRYFCETRLPLDTPVGVHTYASGDIIVFEPNNQNKGLRFKAEYIPKFMSNVHHRTLSAWTHTYLNRTSMYIISGEQPVNGRIKPLTDGNLSLITDGSQIYIVSNKNEVNLSAEA